MKPRSEAARACEPRLVPPRSRPEAPEREAAGAPRDDADRPGRPLRALVVDDDRLVRAVVVDILQANGMACQEAADGAEALEACAAARPDLILLDIVMPGIDGMETCRRLKANPAWSSIPAIALTGRRDAQAVIGMLKAGVLLYLMKPVEPELLLVATRLALAPRPTAPWVARAQAAGRARAETPLTPPVTED